MNKLINYLKVYATYIGVLIVYLLFISIFYYFELLNYKTISVISYIFTCLLYVFLGFRISRYERKKGYLNGFLISIILIIIYSIVLLISKSFSLGNLIYYLILILLSITGGIIGIPNEK